MLQDESCSESILTLSVFQQVGGIVVETGLERVVEGVKAQ